MPNKLVRWIHSGVQACASCLRPSEVKEGAPKITKKRKRRRFWMIRKNNKVGPDPRKENIKTEPKEAKDHKTVVPAKKSVKSPKPKIHRSCEGCKPHSPKSIKARLLKKLKTAKDELQTASNNDISIEPNTRIPCAKSNVVKVENGDKKVKVNGDKKMKVKVDGEKTMKVKVDGDRQVKVERKVKTQVEDAKAAVYEDDYAGKVASYVASVVASAFEVVATINNTDKSPNKVNLGYSDKVSEYVGHDENSAVASCELNDGVVNDQGSLDDVSCAESEVRQDVQKPREHHEVGSEGNIAKTVSKSPYSLEKNPTPRADSYAGLILNIADVIGGMKSSSYQSRAKLIGEMFGGIHQRNEALYKLARSSMYGPAMSSHSGDQAISATRGSGDVDKADHSLPKSPLVGERPEEFQVLRHKLPRSPKRPA